MSQEQKTKKANHTILPERKESSFGKKRVAIALRNDDSTGNTKMAHHFPAKA